MHFYLNGVDSRAYGIYMREPLPIFAAEEDTEYYDVPGRDGSLTIKKGGHNDLETSMRCYIRDIGGISRALAFVQGSGQLVQSIDMGRSINISFTGAPRADRIVRGMDAWEMEIPVRIKPFRYFYPEAEDIVINTSGTYINNPGTHESAPRIEIAGSGDMVLRIGAAEVTLSGVAGGLIIDSADMTCYELDGVTRIGDQSGIDMDEFPRIAPGANPVTWTGSISSITITPRWRDR